MSSYDQNSNWFKQMFPYAKTASQGTGIPAGAILAQWGEETGYGTSDVSQQANNFAGISKQGDAGQYGRYAKYSSIDAFVNDYVHVMNLSYYQGVRSAGDGRSAIAELGKSPWAEDPSYGQNILGIYNTYGLSGYDTYQGGGSAQPAAAGSIPANDKKMIEIGAAFVALMALLK